MQILKMINVGELTLCAVSYLTVGIVGMFISYSRHMGDIDFLSGVITSWKEENSILQLKLDSKGQELEDKTQELDDKTQELDNITTILSNLVETFAKDKTD